MAIIPIIYKYDKKNALFRKSGVFIIKGLPTGGKNAGGG